MREMLYIADVIVDVPTMQTDQPFSYMVPEKLKEVLAIGMRVEVPFGNGNRHIQGFIVNLREQSEKIQQLKPIISVLDLHPVLNGELLALADEMKETTYSFKITCLQTMLPSVMRSTYKKIITQVSDDIPDHIVNELFLGLAEIEWEEAKNSPLFPELLRLKEAGKVDIRYEVNTKNKVKTKRVIKKKMSNEELLVEKESIRKNATQKLRLLHFLLEIKEEEFGVTELIDNFDIARSAINDGEKNNWLIIEEREVYRDPYALHNFKSDSALNLNSEQQHALNDIRSSMDGQQSDVFLLEGVTGSGKIEVYL